MAELMADDHPLYPKEMFRPFEVDYPGFHRVFVRLPEETISYDENDDHPLIVQIMAWMEDPLLKGKFLLYQLTRMDPAFYQARKTLHRTGNATQKILIKAVLMITDVDTALACKIHWG